MQDARALVNWYRHESKLDTKAVTWGIAENFRYLGTMEYGRQAVQQLGRVLGVQVRVYSNTKAGGKYFETPWRKTPDYQGGFLLDGGVHYVAATRFLLGDADSVVRVSAQTAMLQKHLPPIDTLDGVLKTKNGVTGTISIGFGTTLPGYEFSVACEHGSVTVGPKSVVVRQDDGRDGKETKKEYPDQGMGVMAEVKAWAEGLHAGKLDEKQSPEEALKDLMLVSCVVASGEFDGDADCSLSSKPCCRAERRMAFPRTSLCKSTANTLASYPKPISACLSSSSSLSCPAF